MLQAVDHDFCQNVNARLAAPIHTMNNGRRPFLTKWLLDIGFTDRRIVILLLISVNRMLSIIVDFVQLGVTVETELAPPGTTVFDGLRAAVSPIRHVIVGDVMQVSLKRKKAMPNCKSQEVQFQSRNSEKSIF